ncbi:splicing factor SF3a60 homolog [Silene latifolia]|uniref:splicing factor SF3a60 homolog n=1 Tax=Silene latifolia TaxID=37657 RepID=UPI003D77F44F
MDRARPLMFLDRIFKDLEEELRGKKRPRPEPEALMVDANTVEELMELGLEKLKEGLDTLGVKSGGTVRQRAERLLLAKNNKLERRHLKKEEKEKETVLLEAKVKKLCEILSHTLEQTRQHVQNKQAMTPGERDVDAEDEDDVESDNDKDGDDDDKEIYNPLKLPMGWDGRPIPYWLYKLHGLRQEFKCEICGDHTYFGRRAFEMHFKGARHQNGMRCLGIPNTKSFHEITSIQEACNLWQLVKERQGLLKWRPEVDEEFEDADGNVYDTKTFKDLSRQGLI